MLMPIFMPKKVRIRATIPEDLAIGLEALARLKKMDWSDFMTALSMKELAAHGFNPPAEEPEVSPEALAAEVEKLKKKKS